MPNHDSLQNKSGVIMKGYTAYDHIFEGNPSEMTRENARDSFNHFIKHKNEQVLRLEKLLAQNGLRFTGDSDDIRAINMWLNKNICYSEYDFYIDEDGIKQNYINPDWSNILFDLGIYISEIVIQNTDNVSWTFNENVPRNEISYQSPVLTGFSKIKSKGYYRNFGLALFNYAQEIIENPDDASDDFFNFIIEDAIIEDINLEETMFDHTDFGQEIGLN